MYGRLSAIVVGVLGFAAVASATPIAGSSEGIFVNPQGPWGMQVSGVGTKHFQWGEAVSTTPPSWLEFTGRGFSGATDEVFTFGQLNYYNGTVWGGSEANTVDLQVNLSLSAPSLEQDFSFGLNLLATTNYGIDPWADADFVELSSSFSGSNFSIDGVDYTLEFIGFGDVGPAGQVSTINRFHVLENGSASAGLLGRITVAPVPEPATFSFLALSLLGLVGLQRRRR
jgi:hypothetical protein